MAKSRRSEGQHFSLKDRSQHRPERSQASLSSGNPTGQRHGAPLQTQIERDTLASSKNRITKESKRKRVGEQDENFIEEKLSRKIIHAAKEQRDEVEHEDEDEETFKKPDLRTMNSVSQNLIKNDLNLDSDDSLEEDSVDMSDIQSDFSIAVDGPAYEGDIQVTEEDERALDMFLSKDHPEHFTLTQLIMDRIGGTDATSRPIPVGLDAKVVEAFTTMGKILAQYRSGKLPKIFHVIPTLINWEEIVYLCAPDTWTPQATYAATRVFVSAMKPAQAQRFFYLVLLPKIRNDIQSTKKLNFHYFMALKKALYKPSAFYKGIILPLCKSRTCTLKEAVILGGLLHKASIPMAHSSAVLLKISDMEYSGAHSIFIKVLCEKKYALPFRVIDSVVHHFARFLKLSVSMPVIWHQSLLVFAQRYKEDLTNEQKKLLRDVVAHHSHVLITPEIVRELAVTLSRGDRHPLRIAMERMQA